MSKTTNKFSPEFRERAVRMVDEHCADYGSQWAAMTSIAGNAKQRAKPYKMGDAGGGLFLLVQPSGDKLWRLKYRVDGREKKLGIGTYPEVSLAEARKRRDDAPEL